MIPLTTIFQLSRGLVVVALMALAAMPGVARPSATQAAFATLRAAAETLWASGDAPAAARIAPTAASEARCALSSDVELSSGARTISSSPCQNGEPLEALEPEVSEGEDEEKEEERSASSSAAFADPLSAPLAILSATRHATTALPDWVSQLAACGQPRGPPVH